MNENREYQIKTALEKVLTPSHLKLIDESHLHAGHAGAKTGLSHYALEIETSAFNSLSLLERHRLIYEALGTLMQTDIHALRIVFANPTH